MPLFLLQAESCLTSPVERTTAASVRFSKLPMFAVLACHVHACHVHACHVLACQAYACHVHAY